jgi:hypothetical protein
MNQFILKNLFEYALWLMFALVVVPIICLGYYNHPSAADDYCFAYMTRDYGFWKAQWYYYNGWSGRYFANMLFHATPLAWGNFVFVKVMPIVILSLMLHANYMLWRTFFPEFSKRIHITLTLTFIAFFILQMPSLTDTFYWYTSVFIFPSSMVFWQYMLVYLGRFYEENSNSKKILYGFFIATMTFFIVGSNEMMALFCLSFVGIVWGYFLIFKRKFDVLLSIILLLGIAFILLVFTAPGNAVRMHGDGLLGAGIERAFVATFTSLRTDCSKWLFSMKLLPFSVIFAYLLTKYAGSFHQVFRIPFWVSLLAWIGLTAIMFFAIHYGSNLGVPTRVANIIYEFFVLGWLYNLVVLQANYLVFSKIFINKRTYFDIALGLLVIVISLVKSNNIKTAYKELLRGTAKGYDQEMTARYEILRTAKSDTVFVPQLKNKPMTLYFDEIKDNKDFLWNRCYATYYGKAAVVLESKK